jgi:hypothetical protein
MTELLTPLERGAEEGDMCHVMGCTGHYEWKPQRPCSCHINPPCGACTDAPLVCPECGDGELADDAYEEHCEDLAKVDVAGSLCYSCKFYNHNAVLNCAVNPLGPVINPCPDFELKNQ